MFNFCLKVSQVIRGGQVILAALFFFLMGFSSVTWGRARSTYVPSKGLILFFVGQDKQTIDDFVESNLIVPGGVMTYTSIQEMDGLAEPAPDRGAGIQHAQYLLDKYHNVVLQIGLYMVGALEDTVAGVYDDNIDQLGTWISKIQVPVYLRVGYEFDYLANGYEPELYIKAYQHVVDRLRKQRVRNVVFVWHSYGFPRDDDDISAWYPGDNYVDWVALSVFYNYNFPQYDQMAERLKTFGKPLMVAESSPSGVGVHRGVESWEAWYQLYFDFLKRHNIKAFSYINSHWDDMPMFASLKWGDGRVQMNPEVRARFRQEISDPRYLKSDSKLFRQLTR